MEDDKNWNYNELSEKLAMGRIDVDAAAIPLVLEEALGVEGSTELNESAFSVEG